MVEVYHDCYSSAEAINYSVVVHMPNYADYKQADWVHNIGRKAVSINPLANSIEFYFYSVQKTEYISFNVTFKFAKHDPYFKTARIYFTALPIEHMYEKYNRSGDIERNIAVFSPKVKTELIQLIVQESSCNEKIDVHDLTKNDPCQFTASSYLDPVVHAATESYLLSDKGYRSTNWGGQYSVAQKLTVPILDEIILARLNVNVNTTVQKFKLRYSNDIEGKYWRDYEELEVWREFDIDDVYPSNKTSHNHPVYKVGYFDIRVQVRMKWIQFIFTQLKNTPNGLSSGEGVLWRFELSGCLESKAAPSSYIRACGLDREVKLRPESYTRGFLADPDGKALYVCEKNLYKDNAMECLRMTQASNGKFRWTVMTKMIAGVIGYLMRPEYQVFGIGRSQKTYMASSDVGNNWMTVPTKDWWDARAQSSQKFKPVLVMPSELPLAGVNDTVQSWDGLEDKWDNDKTFRANNLGIHFRESNLTDWKLVHNWGSLCCSF
ncbi:uncharacterized protein LOC142345348 [Convolutriloba macropyga]|uniref:uncharacterized protein LOC142345348 n=1 Tax=Convolutriloba macropyga TaxID=536237 RepID=UPI003F526C1B